MIQIDDRTFEGRDDRLQRLIVAEKPLDRVHDVRGAARDHRQRSDFDEKGQALLRRPQARRGQPLAHVRTLKTERQGLCGQALFPGLHLSEPSSFLHRELSKLPARLNYILPRLTFNPLFLQEYYTHKPAFRELGEL